MRRATRRGGKGRAGYTALELVIAVSLLAMFFLGAQRVANNAVGAFRGTRLTAKVEDELRRGLNRTAAELIAVRSGTLDPTLETDFGMDEIVFTSVIGVGPGGPTYGNATRIGLDLADGEADDGVDNDGDGLVDERCLVLQRNFGLAGERRVVLCRSVREFLDGETENGVDDNGNDVVDERGFSVHRRGNVLDIRLTIEQADKDGRPITRTVETTVRMRN